MSSPSQKSTNQSDKTTDTRDAMQPARGNVELLARASPRRVHGLYLHVPFCFHKCHYCDFYSIVDQHDRQAAFAHRLIDELNAAAPHLTHPLRTIFVGGGTPTLLKAELWRALLRALHHALDLSELAEFTVEANPETVTDELLATLVAGGVNRISIGAQSFDKTQLATLERWHEPANVEKAIAAARRAGVENVNLDLIYAVPGQTMPQWRDDLDRALGLAPTHLSCYALTYEPNTPMTKKLQLKVIRACDESLEADMFQQTIDTLAAAGYEQYEISNFAQPGRACLHNLAYWRNENWFAIGPSASGHLDGWRWKNVPHLGKYLAGSGGAPIQDLERLDERASIGEQFMLGIRLIEGIDNRWIDARLDAERRAAVDRHLAAGNLHRTATHTRLTRRGQLLADRIIADVL